MLQLVRKLNARLTRKSAQPTMNAVEQASSVLMPRKPGTTDQCWSADEVRLLLQWELAHRPVHAELSGSQQPYRTLIVGVDMVKNQLLLDALFPSPPVSHLFEEQPFWLTLPLATGDYRICVQARDILPGRELLVDIITTNFRPASAQIREMSFVEDRSPRAQVRLPSGKSVSGRLRTLSTRGATLAVPVSVARDKAVTGEPVNCTIAFNERFTIACNARITHVQRLNGAKLLHLDFAGMDAASASQLEVYIHACENRRD